MDTFKPYKRKGVIAARPHIVGEDMSRISVSQADIDAGYLKREGGMIARATQDHDDQWYINKDFFKQNYEEY